MTASHDRYASNDLSLPIVRYFTLLAKYDTIVIVEFKKASEKIVVFNQPEGYVFDKVNGKIASVRDELEKATEICEFARDRELSKGSSDALKRDVAGQLRKAAEQLEEAIMFADACDC